MWLITAAALFYLTAVGGDATAKRVYREVGGNIYTGDSTSLQAQHRPFWAQLTSYDGVKWYSWVEMQEGPDGTFVPLNGGRYGFNGTGGNPVVYPAFSAILGAQVVITTSTLGDPAGTYVKLRRHAFDYNADGSVQWTWAFEWSDSSQSHSVPCTEPPVTFNTYRTDCIEGVNWRFVQVVSIGCTGVAVSPYTFDSFQGCCVCTSSSSGTEQGCCCPSEPICIIWPGALCAEMEEGIELQPQFDEEACQWMFVGSVCGGAHQVIISAVWFGCTGPGLPGTLMVSIFCTDVVEPWAVYFASVPQDDDGCWCLDAPVALTLANNTKLGWCVQCVAQTPFEVDVVLSGYSGPLACFNATFSMFGFKFTPWQLCAWQQSLNDCFVTTSLVGNPGAYKWQVTLVNGPSQATYQSGLKTTTTVDCCSDIGLSLVGDNTGSDPPLTITITPLCSSSDFSCPGLGTPPTTAFAACGPCAPSGTGSGSEIESACCGPQCPTPDIFDITLSLKGCPIIGGPPGPCTACSVTPTTIGLSLAGFSGPFACFNGNWQVFNVPETGSQCTWSSSEGPGTPNCWLVVSLTGSPGNLSWTVQLNTPTDDAVYVLLIPVTSYPTDCCSPVTVPLSFATSPGAVGAITLLPSCPGGVAAPDSGSVIDINCTCVVTRSPDLGCTWTGRVTTVTATVVSVFLLLSEDVHGTLTWVLWVGANGVPLGVWEEPAGTVDNPPCCCDQLFMTLVYSRCVSGRPIAIATPVDQECNSGSGSVEYWCVCVVAGDPSCFPGSVICIDASALIGDVAIDATVQFAGGSSGQVCTGIVIDGPFFEFTCNGGCHQEDCTGSGTGTGSEEERWWCLESVESASGEGGITVDCCPPGTVIPVNLVATITNGGAADGFYLLVFNPNAINPEWDCLNVPFGDCPTPPTGSTLALICNLGVWFLQGAYIPSVSPPASFDCSVPTWTFNGVDTTGGGGNPCGGAANATVTIGAGSPTGSGTGSGTQAETFVCAPESQLSGDVGIGGEVTYAGTEWKIVNGPFNNPQCDNTCPPIPPPPCCGLAPPGPPPFDLSITFGGHLAGMGSITLFGRPSATEILWSTLTDVPVGACGKAFVSVQCVVIGEAWFFTLSVFLYATLEVGTEPYAIVNNIGFTDCVMPPLVIQFAGETEPGGGTGGTCVGTYTATAIQIT